MKKWIIGGIGMIIIIGSMIILRDRETHITSDHRLPVTVVEVDHGVQDAQHTFGATVKSTQEAVVRARVNGVLMHMNVQEGDHVKKGQIIAEIDADEYAAQYAQSTLSLHIAQEEEKYARRKWDDLKPEQRAQIKLESERQRAIVAESRAYIEKTHIIAPFDGVMSRKFVSEGTTVSMGESIVRVIGDLSQKEIVFDVPATQEWDIVIGENIRIQYNDHKEEAQIVAIDPVSSEQTRKITVHATLQNNSPVSIGEFVHVDITSKNRVEGFFVPVAAIVRMYDDQFVFVINEDRAVMRNVRVLGVDHENVLVDGIQNNDRIAVYGAQQLSDGDQVEIITIDE